MAWVNQPSSGQVNPLWDYREGMKFISIVPNTSRALVLLTDVTDPTGTWKEPLGVWVHGFRGVSGGSATVICSRYKRACPFCYENEIFKLSNPHYKELKQRLPYSPKFNALLQVYDVQLGGVFWALFTKTQIDGINFLMTNFPQQFKNTISLSRIGAGLETSYRVDNFPMEITDAMKATIREQMIPLDDTIWNRIMLSDEEIKQKSGIDPAFYFSQKLAQNLPIDISQWGDVPQMLNRSNVAPAMQSPIAGAIIPPMEQPAPVMPQVAQPAVPNNPQLSAELAAAVSVVCSVGVYAGQTLGTIIKQTGKTYITYLAQASENSEEKASATLILQNWDVVNQYVAGILF